MTIPKHNTHHDMELLNSHIQKQGISTTTKRGDTSSSISFSNMGVSITITKTKSGYSLRETCTEDLEFEYEMDNFKALTEIVKEEYVR